MSNYSCDCHLFRPWVCSVSVSVHMCDCMWLCVWSYSHHTYMPPPHCRGPLPLHPETQLRALAGKQAWAGGCRDETGSPGSSFPSSSLKARWQDADGPRCQGKAKAQSISTQLADCGTWSNPNLSHLSACFALSHARSHRGKQEGLIRPAFHSSYGGPRVELLKSRDVATDNFSSAVGQLFLRARKKRVVSLKATACCELQVINYQQMLFLLFLCSNWEY